MHRNSELNSTVATTYPKSKCLLRLLTKMIGLGVLSSPDCKLLEERDMPYFDAFPVPSTEPVM